MIRVSEKKYVLTEQEEVYNGNVYRQVKAVKTFKTIEGETVKAGTLGGFIQDESCLSQDGRCWVDKYSHVMAGSIVKDDALLSYSFIEGNSCICDKSNLDEVYVSGTYIGGNSGLTYANIEGKGLRLMNVTVYYSNVTINGEITLFNCRFARD